MALPAPRRSGGKDLLSAELIAERTFPLARRGYERDDVQEFLRQVADAVTALYSRLDDADEALREAQERAEHPDISEDVLMARVGEETAGILRSARAASTDMQKRAGDEAARLVDEAHQQAGGIRTEAEAVMARSVEEANRSAEEIRAGAQQAADQMLERAKQEVESLRQMAEQERKLTVEGAQAVRDKILADLTRRRRVATVQIEQLRAGRERLLESYALVRSTLQEINDDLERADAEARAAADEAGKVWEVAELPELPPDLLTSPRGSADAPVGVVEEIVVEEATAALDVAELAGEAQVEESPPSEPEGEASTSDEAEAVDEGEPAAPSTEAADTEPPPEEPAPAAEAAETSDDAPQPEPEATSEDEPKVEEPVAQEAKGEVEEPVADEAKDPVDEPISPAAEERGRAATKSGSARTRTKSRRRPSSPPTPGSDRQGPAPAGDAGDTAKSTTPKAEPVVTTAATATATATVDDDEDDAAGGIFERIRAGRQEAVQAARRTLNGDEEAAGSDAAADDPTESTSTGPAAPGSTAHPVEEEHSEVVRSDVDETLLERRDQVLGELEVILTRKLKRALQDEQNDLLDKMRNGKGEPQLETLLGTEPDQQRRYRDAALPQLELAAREGARFAADVISEQGGKTAPKRAPKVDELADELASELSGHIRRRVETAIGTGRGDDQAVLVEAISAAYREIKTQRVESSAGDTAGGAFNRGIWETVGDRIPLRWVVEDVDGPCADCDDNALAGGIPRHEGFPTGQAHPPAHAGCRCLLVPDPS